MKRTVEVDLTPRSTAEVPQLLVDAADLIEQYAQSINRQIIEEFVADPLRARIAVLEAELERLQQENIDLRNETERVQEPIQPQPEPQVPLEEVPKAEILSSIDLRPTNWMPKPGDQVKIKSGRTFRRSLTGRVAKCKPTSRKVLILPEGQRRHEWFDLDHVYPVVQ